MRILRFSTVGLVALGLGCAPGAAPERQAAAITDGTEDTGHPAVGKLVFAYSGGTEQDGACTATLVGQRTVLTAAHCVGYPNTEFIQDTGDRFAADATVGHPSFDKSAPYLYDIGLVLLKQAPPVVPARVHTAPPVAGTPITFVGYGRTAATLDDQGVKRVATNTIAAVKELYFTIVGTGNGSGNACHGDSGGPVMVTEGGHELIVGLLSYITDFDNCGTTTRATRLDLYQSWLVQESAGDVRFVDKQPPQVAITAPEDGAVVGLAVDVEVTATDNETVALVELYVDGQQAGSATAPPYLFQLELEPGDHDIEAVAWDEAQNDGSAAIAISVAAPDEGGCQLGGGGPAGAGLLLGLSLLLALSRRRGRGRRGASPRRPACPRPWGPRRRPGWPAAKTAGSGARPGPDR